MNCDIFIPVRLSSTRLPNKAILVIDNKPIIELLIDRLKKSKKSRKIIVCTTIEKSDDSLVNLLHKKNIEVFRGEEDDLLSRYSAAANKMNSDFIVSVDGDDIFTDPFLVDIIIDKFLITNSDYVKIHGLPFGMAPVGFTRSALQQVCSMKKTSNTATGYKNFFDDYLDKQKCTELKYDLSYSDKIRLTLDYNEDFELAKKIFQKLGNNFHLNDLLTLFKNFPELLKITNGLETKYKEHWKMNVSNTSIKDI